MKKISKKKAFSIPELAIVLLTIGAILAAISSVKSLLQKNKLNNAIALTNNSIIQTLPNLTFWYDVTNPKSFNRGENRDGATVNILHDLNPQSTSKLDGYGASAASGDSSQFYYNFVTGATTSNTSGPAYVENGINGLPSVRFANNGDSAYRYLMVDKNFNTTSQEDLTMFIIFKYHSGAGYLVDRLCQNSSGTAVDCSSDIYSGKPLFGLYSSSSGDLSFYVRHDSGNFTSLGAAGFDTGFNLESGGKYLVTIERKYNDAFNIYINGTSSFGGTSSKADSGEAMHLAAPKLGRHISSTTSETIDWELSEALFFTGTIHANDRDAVEDYLGEKYNIEITQD